MVGELSGRQPYEEMESIFKEGGRVKELENVFFLFDPSCSPFQNWLQIANLRVIFSPTY